MTENKLHQRVLVLMADNKPDSSGDIWNPLGIQLPDGEVPVLLNFETHVSDYLGTARLVRGEEGRIYADLELIDPVWLNTPQALNVLTPAVGGVCLETKADDPRVLERTMLTCIGLSLGKNVDPRIRSLGQQKAEEPCPVYYGIDPTTTPGWLDTLRDSGGVLTQETIEDACTKLLARQDAHDEPGAKE